MASLCTAIQALGLIIAPLLSTFLYHYAINLPFYLLGVLMFSVGLYLAWILMLQNKTSTKLVI